MADTAETLQSKLVGEMSGRNRREGERVIAYWKGKLEEFGEGLTLAALDFSRIVNQDWSNRFLIAIDPIVEKSSFILYGSTFASLLHLPVQTRPSVPMARQLPHRYVELFVGGCAKAQTEMAPVRLEGESKMSDGRIEQYRAVFIPLDIKQRSPASFAFGAFSSRTW